MGTRNAQLTMIGLSMLLLPQLATAHRVTPEDVRDFPTCKRNCTVLQVLEAYINQDINRISPAPTDCGTCKANLAMLKQKHNGKSSDIAQRLEEVSSEKYMKRRRKKDPKQERSDKFEAEFGEFHKKKGEFQCDECQRCTMCCKLVDDDAEQCPNPKCPHYGMKFRRWKEASGRGADGLIYGTHECKNCLGTKTVNSYYHETTEEFMANP